jgi:hypothetical protein
MYDWLSRNKIYFEALGPLTGVVALAISIVAIVISLNANATQHDALKVTRIESDAQFDIRESITGDNRVRLTVYNYGGAVTDVRIEAHPVIEVDCFPPDNSHSGIRRVTWDLSHAVGEGGPIFADPTGNVAYIEWDGLNSLTNAADRVFSPPIPGGSVKRLVFANPEEAYYVAIRYRNRLGEQVARYFDVRSFGRVTPLTKRQWSSRLAKAISDVWGYEKGRHGGPVQEAKATIARRCRNAYR